jgi:GNAT superfamily N-acetyltransferase
VLPRRHRRRRDARGAAVRDARLSRRGIGEQLIEVVAGWAREAGRPVLTLRTFRDGPWNAPYYRRPGFSDIPDALLTPRLRALGDVQERLV